MSSARTAALLLAFATAACAASPPALPAPALPVPERTGDIHDFDFQAGSWRVHNRTRKPGADWVEFPSTVCMMIQLGGAMNIELTSFPTKGYSASAVRTFDLAKRQWSIYWVDGRSGILLPPARGGFEGDRGEFYALDDGQLYRLAWTRLGPDAARWEQAASPDGQRWEASWTMEFTRTGPPGCTAP